MFGDGGRWITPDVGLVTHIVDGRNPAYKLYRLIRVIFLDIHTRRIRMWYMLYTYMKGSNFLMGSVSR